jgi:hypothetical protein
MIACGHCGSRVVTKVAPDVYGRSESDIIAAENFIMKTKLANERRVSDELYSDLNGIEKDLNEALDALNTAIDAMKSTQPETRLSPIESENLIQDAINECEALVKKHE